MGAVVTVGTHGSPEVAHVVHRAGGELLLHPAHVVRVVEEDGHLRRRERKLQPPLGMGSGGLAIEKGGTGAQGQQQGPLAAEQTQAGEERVHRRQAEVDVHAGGHHPGAVGVLDVGVVGVGGIRSLEAVASSGGQGAARQQGEPTGPQPAPQPLPRFQQQLQLTPVAGIRRGGVLKVALVRLGHETGQLPRRFSRAAHRRAVGAARIHLNLEALQQQVGSAHGLAPVGGSRQARALSMPRALLRVSWYSEAGTESATMPAPA